MSMNVISVRGRIVRGGIKYTALCAAALFLLYGCGGGFGTDSEHASEIGPGIFEPDTAKRK